MYNKVLSIISDFSSINILIGEYYGDKENLHPNKLIMQYYPRMFVLLVASTFERKIKDAIDVFVANSLVNYPNISNITSEKLYKRFYTDPNRDATPFYNYFVSIDFENQLNTRFANLLSSYKLRISEKIGKLKAADIPCDELENVSLILEETDFKMAENAFLEIKYYRNMVAHNFLTNNFSNKTFNDIKEYYYKSMYYVEALEQLLFSL